MRTLRAALRALRAAPLVSTIAILSLALGIGANTAIFSITDALILRSLPVEHAQRLALLRLPESRTSWTNPIWEAVRSRQELWDGGFAAGRVGFNAATSGEVDVVDGFFTSGRYFEILGVQPALGRFYGEADDRRGGGPDGAVAVISDALWRTRFGAAPDILGRTFTLSRVNYTIIGVAPRTFFGHEVGRRADVWVPLGTEPLVRGESSYLDRRSTWWMQVFVRLKPGQTAEAATTIFAGVQPAIREETVPENYRPQDAERYLTDPMHFEPASAGVSGLRTRYQRPLMALTAVVAFTLLIACGNIANLLLARATARRHEFAVRTALGASRWRIARQLVAENLVLSTIGAVVGIGVALLLSKLIIAQIATPNNRLFLDIGLDWRMLGFTALVALVTTLLFGVGPALLAARVPPMEALKEQGRGSGSKKAIRVAGSLVVAQVSLSLLLLVGAGLFVRTFLSLADLELGFAPERVLIANVNASRTGVPEMQLYGLYERILESARAVPGVTDAGFSVISPVSGSQWNGDLVFPEKPELPESERIVNFNYITPGWFSLMRTPLLAGRDFGPQDRVGAPLAGVVNQQFVQKYFDGQSPLGKTVRTADYPSRPGQTIEIVGVVGDAVYTDLREPLSPTLYWAMSQSDEAPSSAVLTLRTTSEVPQEVSRAVTAALTGVHPDLSVSYRSLADDVSAALSQERLIALLSAFFGALALLLAALGLYGITAYAVIRRRAEIGIRLALGASPGQVVRMVLSRTGLLVGSGIVVGGAAAWYLSRFVSALLFGLDPTDPVTIAGAMLVLAAISTVAAWIPARQAARVDPAEALREG
jgi:putative ABC transport system permease protein